MSIQRDLARFDRMVYVIACIVTLGFVYLIRVIITQAIAYAE